jgi:hypothetical protein
MYVSDPEVQGCLDRARARDARTVYVSAPETSKLIRATLKRTFPGITFTVRTKCYSGGASATIGWWDGPTQDEVERALAQYEGKGPMDQSDYSPYLFHEVDGQRISYGTDYIFTNRRFSQAFAQEAVDAVCDKWDISPWPTVGWHEEFGANFAGMDYIFPPGSEGEYHWSLSALAMRRIEERD